MGNAASRGGSGAKQPEGGRKEGPKCYYELLGVQLDATGDEVKRAYRQQALRLHPDKNPHRLEEAHHEFAAIQAAYEVLSDPQERAFYDRHRSSILASGRRQRHSDDDVPDLDDLIKYFSPTAYEGYGDGPQGFFTVYRELFEYLEEFEAEEEILQHEYRRSSESPKATYTSFGSKNAPYEPMVRQFYEKWLHFSSARTFEEGDKYQPHYSDNRRMRRAMDKENAKEREKLRREFSSTVQQLAAYVRKRDPRYAAYQKERTEQRERDEAERRARERAKREADVANFVEQAWARVEHEQFARAAGWESAEDEEDAELEAEEVEEYYCAPCKKLFKKLPQWQNHEKSKKHRTTLLSLGIDPDLGDEGAGNDDDDGNRGDWDDEKGYYAASQDEHHATDQDEHHATDQSENHATSQDEHHADATKPDFADGLTESLCSMNISAPVEAAPEPKAKKGRRAKDKKKTAAAAEAEESQKCNVCGGVFPSRNQLFKHVKEEGHALAVPVRSKRR